MDDDLPKYNRPKNWVTVTLLDEDLDYIIEMLAKDDLYRSNLICDFLESQRALYEQLKKEMTEAIDGKYNIDH